MSRYGVVLFDDVVRKRGKDRKRMPTEGWAAIAGESATFVRSITDLPSDVKWLTNLEFADFYANQLGKHPNLLHSAALRTEVRAILEEIGAGVEYMSTERASQALSSVFSRVMGLAVESLGVKVDLPGIKTLSELISARTVNKYRPPDEVNQALLQAYQTTTQCLTRFNREWKSVTLRRPRYQHAIDVLSSPVPSEFRWRYINSDRMPLAGARRVDWCLGHDLPVLANVKVTQRRNDLAPVISYNSGATVQRAWLSQPELLWISMWCDVEVIGAYICDAGFEPQKEIDTFPALGDFSFASYSLGLLVENLWVAMASPRSNVVGQKFHAPRAVWYRAVDRMECFKAAAQIHRAGFQVVGYGVGSVWINYPVGATREVVDLATSIGLDVPAGRFADLRNEIRLVKDE